MWGRESGRVHAGEWGMNVFAKNERLKAALGIRSIAFMHYRSGNAHWRVVLDDGEEFGVVTHNFGTESTVLRFAAEKLAKMNRGVVYPKGSAGKFRVPGAGS